MTLRFRLLILFAFLFLPSLSFAQGHVTCVSTPGGRRVYCQADTRGGVALVVRRDQEFVAGRELIGGSTPAESGSSAVARRNLKCANIMAGRGGGIPVAAIVRSRGEGRELVFIATWVMTGRTSVWRVGRASITCPLVLTMRSRRCKCCAPIGWSFFRRTASGGTRANSTTMCRV